MYAETVFFAMFEWKDNFRSEMKMFFYFFCISLTYSYLYTLKLKHK